jgi:hypothetical protein
VYVCVGVVCACVLGFMCMLFAVYIMCWLFVHRRLTSFIPSSICVYMLSMVYRCIGVLP